MDRKIELEQISDEMFNELLLTVNAEVLEIARSAQDKINELLSRFNIQCSVSLSYMTPEQLNNIPDTSTVAPEITIPKKKKSGGRRKKTVTP